MNKIQNPPRESRWVTPRREKSSQPTVISVSKTNSTLIRVGGQIVGDVSGNVHIKQIKASRHLLHTPPAVVFYISNLEQAKRAGPIYIEVYDEEFCGIVGGDHDLH